MNRLEDMFFKTLIVVGCLFTAVWIIAVVHDTPAKCWFSYAPFTCAKVVELEQRIK